MESEKGFDFSASQERLMRMHDTLSILLDHVDEQARGVLIQQLELLQAEINTLGEYLYR